MTENAMKRRQMILVMEDYVEALIEKKPENLPLASSYRATYNGQEVEVGDNELWKNTLIIKERQTFIDPISGEMVFFGIMSNETLERNEPFPIDVHVYFKIYAATIRLKLVDGKITEIEELACDERLRYFYGELRDISLPDPEFDIVLPEEERCTREELIELVENYWKCAAKEISASVLKIHPDAQRYENGFRTTNHSNSFRGDFKHNPNFCWKIPESTKLYPVVDPVRGLVVSSCFMMGGGNVRDGGKGARVVEAFKIKDGALFRLIAFFPILNVMPGWEKK